MARSVLRLHSRYSASVLGMFGSGPSMMSPAMMMRPDPKRAFSASSTSGSGGVGLSSIHSPLMG